MKTILSASVTWVSRIFATLASTAVLLLLGMSFSKGTIENPVIKAAFGGGQVFGPALRSDFQEHGFLGTQCAQTTG